CSLLWILWTSHLLSCQLALRPRHHSGGGHYLCGLIGYLALWNSSTGTLFVQMMRFVFALLCCSAVWAKPHIVTSFSILGDMVKTVGGTHVDVSAIVGPNQDAHVYEARPKDAKTIAKADLVIINGLGF